MSPRAPNDDGLTFVAALFYYVYMRRFLMLLLAVFILADIFLFSFYFINKSRNPVSLSPTKQFKSEDSRYKISPGKVNISQGNLDQLLLKEALLYGIINKPPRKESSEWDLAVSFSTSSKKNFIADIVLTHKNDQILALLAKNGIIGKRQIWSVYNISDIIPYLKVGNPILIKLNIEEASDVFLNNAGCDLYCRSFYEVSNKFLNNNLALMDQVNGKNDVKNQLQVGPVNSIVIFTPN